MKKNAPFFQNLVKNPKSYIEVDPDINISFHFQARVSIDGYSRKEYVAEFWNTLTGQLEYRTSIGSGMYAAPSKTYFVPWEVKVFEGEKLVTKRRVDLKEKIVHVFIDSSSLGDNLAWVPQAVRFSEINQCKLILTSFYNDLFKEKYPQVIWNYPGTGLPHRDYSYKVGYFFTDDIYNKTPVDPRTSPLGKVAADILGIEYQEIRPILDYEPFQAPPIEKPYVCIATSSTAGAKLWQRPGAWQEVVDYLNSKGLEVAVIQKEPTELKGIIDWSGDIPLKERMNQLHHSNFFIGLGSGLSWLAWAVKKKVILISGFSDPKAEFSLDCERIINRSVCNSCWNDTTQHFDRGDWNWCPRLKGTERQFECTKQIEPSLVFERIDKLLSL
jgi:autotransporter strand-loop-strand O-heptosyltransferase